MTDTHSIQIELPIDLYEWIRAAAARSDQAVESVLIDSLALLFGAPPADWDHLMKTLETLPDAQLWALIYRRMTWPEGMRLRELTERGQQAPLLDDEQAEVAALIDKANPLTLFRSRALLILRQRGYDIRTHLKLGA